MTGHLNSSSFQNDFSTESANEVSLDFDEIIVDESNLSKTIKDNEIHTKPADIRRRLEERLEAKNLRDQLGMDDLIL
jgi:hypothetical protein